MAKRKSLSKKTRFEVFKRDGFVCQYCGATPPSVILHVDHIHPVAEGGENDMDNLITACSSCNLGKSANLLTNIPKSLKDKTAEVAEREEQLKGYNAILMAKAERLENEAWEVIHVLENSDKVESFDRKNFMSIKKFLEKLPLADVLRAAEITSSKWRYIGDAAFRYFCGICWSMIRELENGSR